MFFFFNIPKIFSSLLIIYFLFYYGLNIIKFLFLKILKIGFWFFISSKTKNKNKKFYAETKIESNITESLTSGAFSLATYLLSFTATSALKITVAGAWKSISCLKSKWSKRVTELNFLGLPIRAWCVIFVSRIRVDFLGHLEKCCTTYKLDVNQKNSQKGNRNID